MRIHFGVLLALVLLAAQPAFPQFLETFDATSLVLVVKGNDGWAFFTGDGAASIAFAATGQGYASVNVDATHDRMGVWWAVIKRRVSQDLDLARLASPRCAVRIEARIRVSDSPKRVNLSLNSQRTTDFHTHLMEFDIPDTVNWHTISMTARGFEAAPGDTVYGQLALMDWGLGKYRVDVDYFRVDVVNVDSAGPDEGVQVPYHPPLRDPSTFSRHLRPGQAGMVDLQFPHHCFRNWSAGIGGTRTRLLTVGGSQFVLMRWNKEDLGGRGPEGSAELELTVFAREMSTDYRKDFGLIRVVEILGGDPGWTQDSLTAAGFLSGQPVTKALNEQMIIDVEVPAKRGGRTLITIPNPVLKRMAEGRTLGIAIVPLGAIHASFYAPAKGSPDRGPVLHYNLHDPIRRAK